MWGFYESTTARLALEPGDFVAFYAAGQGVAAHARVGAKAVTLLQPHDWPEPHPQGKRVYRLPLTDVMWLEKPLVITEAVRAQLEAFRGKRPNGNWAWLVQTTRRLTRGDFKLLTGQEP